MGEREAGICPDGHTFIYLLFILILFLWYIPLEFWDWEKVNRSPEVLNAGSGVRSGCVVNMRRLSVGFGPHGI